MIDIKPILEEMSCELDNYKVLKEASGKIVLQVCYEGNSRILRVYSGERATKIEKLYTKINGSVEALPIIYNAKWCQNNRYYALIEEKVNGHSLRDYITQTASDYSEVNDVNYYEKIIETFEILKALCVAVKGLHQLNPPVIHCDLKPEHIFVEDNEHIKIIDLDIAMTEGEKKEKVEGTRGYIAPEAISKTGKLTVASDIYAFGEIIVDLCETYIADSRFNTIKSQVDSLINNCQRNDGNRISSDDILRSELIKIQVLVLIHKKKAELKSKNKEITVIDKDSIQEQPDNDAEVTIIWSKGKGKIVLYPNKVTIVNHGVFPPAKPDNYYFDKIKAALYQEDYDKKIIRLIYDDNDKDVFYIDDIEDSEIAKSLGELLTDIISAREHQVDNYYTELFYNQNILGNNGHKEWVYEKRIIIGEILRQRKRCQCDNELITSYEHVIDGEKDIKNQHIKKAIKYYRKRFAELSQECSEGITEYVDTANSSSKNMADSNNKVVNPIRRLGKAISKVSKKTTSK